MLELGGATDFSYLYDAYKISLCLSGRESNLVLLREPRLLYHSAKEARDTESDRVCVLFGAGVVFALLFMAPMARQEW